jgi:predicted GIY-YIG superfamily endonuclease
MKTMTEFGKTDSWQMIEIPEFRLIWSREVSWDELALGVVDVPSEAGVYSVYRIDEEDAPALHIGQTNDLYRRITQDLIKGTHSAGKRIRKKEDTSRLIIMWAVTDRPAAVEEELHRLHKEAHDGQLPIYTLVT